MQNGTAQAPGESVERLRPQDSPPSRETSEDTTGQRGRRVEINDNLTV
jgi:hypothetical protein